jgi:hypothetical protein
MFCLFSGSCNEEEALPTRGSALQVAMRSIKQSVTKVQASKDL